MICAAGLRGKDTDKAIQQFLILFYYLDKVRPILKTALGPFLESLIQPSHFNDSKNRFNKNTPV